MRRIIGNQMLVIFPGGGNIQLSPGDCLCILPRTTASPSDKLGVVYAKTTPTYRETEEPDPLGLKH
jgi:hypothetical protein